MELRVRLRQTGWLAVLRAHTHSAKGHRAPRLLARVHDLAGCSCEISLPSRPSMTEHGGVVGLPPPPPTHGASTTDMCLLMTNERLWMRKVRAGRACHEPLDGRTEMMLPFQPMLGPSRGET